MEYCLQSLLWRIKRDTLTVCYKLISFVWLNENMFCVIRIERFKAFVRGWEYSIKMDDRVCNEIGSMQRCVNFKLRWSDRPYTHTHTRILQREQYETNFLPWNYSYTFYLLYMKFILIWHCVCFFFFCILLTNQRRLHSSVLYLNM